jgi:TonB-dependent SusC/RagA subfamily outer membrane receptor
MKIRVFLYLLLALLFILPVSGQKAGKKITITGHAIDGTDAPIANAVIMIDGKRTDCLTDRKGYYKIKVRHDNKKIGVLTYTSGIIEETFNGRTTIDFRFEGQVPDQKRFGTDPFEEDIDTGMGTVKKRAVTGPIGKIDGTKPKYASYNSIYDMIRGEVPGVVVSGTSVMIRGATSIMGSNEPLFVVDGTPVTTIENIEPRMVKSIQVLKGSSASIYGVRGSNGVIVISLLGSRNR